MQQGLLSKNISEAYFHLPYDYVKDVICAKPTPQQKQVLLALQEGKHFISVSSGHGVGKTALEAWIVQWFLATHPYARVPCTAPTSPQLLHILWPEIRKWQEKSTIGNWFQWTNTTFSIRGKEKTWFAVARTSNKPDNMQGFHADHLMFVIDEASGVPEDIMEVVEGALTGGEAYCIMFGNPTKLSGTHYNSFHKDKKLWTTFVFSAEDSPLVRKSYCERIAARFGRESDIYRVRVLGLFPLAETDTIFSIDEVQTAMQRIVPKPSVMQIVLGVDVARFGDAKTVIAKRHGLRIEIMNKFYKQDTMYTTGVIVNYIKEFEEKGYEVLVNVDDTGVGGGVVDRLRELALQNEFKAMIIPVNNGSRAFDPEHFANLGTEMWYKLKDGIKDYKLPDDEDVIGELTTRKKKFNSAGKILLERKEDMRKRGIASPDTADAIVLTMDVSEEISYLDGGEGIIF